MSVSLADSLLWSGLYSDAELAALLDDSALLAAMVRVEVALAEGCVAAGMIPTEAGLAIANGLVSFQPDPAALSAAAARDGVPVPGLVRMLRAVLPAELAPWLHWGATSQDIVDTATVLQLALALDVIEVRLRKVIGQLGDLAGREAETVMAARTRTQIGLPTTFGALVAGWGAPLIAHLDRMAEFRPRLLRLSLHGAVGSDAALGKAAGAVRAKMATALGLSAPDLSWHSARDGMAETGSVLTLISGSLGKIGLDVATLVQSGLGEVRITGGGSSTMPHKSNPVVAEALVALARANAHRQGALFDAQLHGQSRDGAAWALEWDSLRQIAVATGAGLAGAAHMLAGLRPDRARMVENLAAAGFGPFAEGAVFALASILPRPEAEAVVKHALQGGDPAASLEADFPQIPWDRVLAPLAAAGASPVQARLFAAAAASLRPIHVRTQVS